MRTTTNRLRPFLMLMGPLPVLLAGCGGTQTALTPAPPPPPKAALTAQEQQTVNSIKSMPPAQQQQFLKNNPQLAQNPLVIAQMRESMVNK